MSEIEGIRREIDQVDDEVCALLARRHELARRAAFDRSWAGRPDRDRRREAEVLARVRGRVGYAPEVADKVWGALFDASEYAPPPPMGE